MGLHEATAANQYRIVHCDKHGDRREAFVCDHLLSGTRQGFFIDPDDVENPHPDAWCSTCERIRLTYGGSDGKWNETSEALIKVRLVCGDCYEEIKIRNVLGNEGIKSVQ